MLIGIITHLGAALAFFGLAGLSVLALQRTRRARLFFAACLITATWAMMVAYDEWLGGRLYPLVDTLEVGRSAAWIGLLYAMLPKMVGRPAASAIRTWPVISIAGLSSVLIAYTWLGWSGIAAGYFDWPLQLVGGLLLAVIGLVYVENLFRNTPSHDRWAIKLLCLGVGGMFLYDFFIYSDALLFKSINSSLWAARGSVTLVLAPLLAVAARRNRKLSLDLMVSRQVVIHSTTLVVSGVYLLIMAGAGYYIRHFGGSWATVIQITFVAGSLVVLMVLLVSGTTRAYLRVFLNKHFFRYRYDYREEWLRFIQAISERAEGPLGQRVVRMVADIMDSTEGALFFLDEGGRFELANEWNYSGPKSLDDPGGVVARTLERENWILDLDNKVWTAERLGGASLPDWITDIRRPWLITPLTHHDTLIGMIVLGRPRVNKRLNWEDYDLLRIVGRGAASYLAEQQAAEALAEARQFEALNRRFAFVIHDIKNLVSQLSLMVRNAEKHLDKPEFQADMLATVQDSVAKMTALLAQMHRDGDAKLAEVDLPQLLGRVANRTVEPGATLALNCQVREATVMADPDRLDAVISHLVENALDAIAGRGKVEIGLETQDGMAIIEVADDGPGMDADFIRNHLFQPFRTTKGAGFGIGAYESRDFARELGGRLDVESEVGKGTAMRLQLPLVSKGHDENNGKLQSGGT